MVYVVKRGWKPVGHLMQEYWSERFTRPHMSATKKAEELRNAAERAHREAICIGIAAVLTEARINKYEHVGDTLPMVEYWDVQKVFEADDKDLWPPAREDRDAFFERLYGKLMSLVDDEHLEKRNTQIRREKVVAGEIEANEEDKAYFAEQARQLQEQAQRFSQLGSGHTVEYLVKGGRTEIEI